MKPWEAAKKWQLEHSDVSFEEVLSHYFNAGLVWSDADHFLVAQKGNWNGEDMYVGAVDANCWVVQLASGENPFSRFLEIAPEQLKFVAWQRGKEKWHVWEWEKFEKKVNKNG
jgi:hypothetical protein